MSETKPEVNDVNNDDDGGKDQGKDDLKTKDKKVEKSEYPGYESNKGSQNGNEQVNNNDNDKKTKRDDVKEGNTSNNPQNGGNGQQPNPQNMTPQQYQQYQQQYQQYQQQYQKQYQQYQQNMQQQQQQQKEDTSNLYVAGFSTSWSEDDLEQCFSRYGKITESRILRNAQTKQSRGVGFVRFEKSDGAKEAIEGMNGRQLEDASQPLVVKVAKARKRHDNSGYKRQQGGQGYGPGSYGGQQNVRYNPYQYAQYAQAYYNQYGKGQYAQYAQQYANQYANQYAQYQQQQQPQQQQQQQSGGQSGGQFPGYCLFVFHLPPHITEENLKALFTSYGSVISVRVMRDKNTQLSKGFGFVNMQSYQEAQAAVNGLNGHKMGTKFLKVTFKKGK